MNELPETIDGLPNICGFEDQIAEAMKERGPIYVGGREPGGERGEPGGIDFSRIKSAFAVALHMHQPLIPAGGGNGGGEGDPQSAAIVSNLQYMMEHPEIQDAHNAPVFRWCYQRMGEFIPQLAAEGLRPRVMLDYSGCLLHGLRLMGASDVIDSLRGLVMDRASRACVEWLGTAWGHAVAPSTPAQDFRLHVRAWQHHFAGMFGLEALSRVRGFSPPEMALPNHPDVCYEFVRTLKECGFKWVLVQEHSVERVEDGGALRMRHLPHRLVATNSSGQTASIIAIIKTQGSDTKLVAQMQPRYEAMTLSRVGLAGKNIPQLVTQIGDGENGGVMMNEFPPMYMKVMRECSGTETPAMNATEYLEHLEAMGIVESDFPAIQPVMQQRIWSRFEKGAGRERLEQAIEQLRREDGRFHVEGGSWTGNISWTRGYENVLGPMGKVSARFDEKYTRGGIAPSDPRYREALYHLLLTQTSCFRYWGQGGWTDYARELCRRAERD